MIFDSGPVISLTLNNILWLLESMNDRFKGDFLITREVYNELIERPLSTKKFKFEALQILPLITKGILKLVDEPEIDQKTKEILDLANSCFIARDKNLSIVHRGEAQAIACALVKGADTIVIDERTTRVLIESPGSLENHLRHKLHTHVHLHNDNMDRLRKEIGHLKVVRSFDLAIIAFEMGLLNMYALKELESTVPDIRKAVLEGVLWGLKLNGCSVKKEEIYQVLEQEN